MAESGKKLSDFSGSINISSAEDFDHTYSAGMAVSGKKMSDFSGSINISSAEDFEHTCESCLTAGQHIEAHGFCVECTEYLCKTCFTYHQRTKATRNHQLLDKADIDKKGIPRTHSTVCMEKCHIHTDEVIKFFCLQHEELACHDCVSLEHRTCDLDYIPDKCSDIGESEEFRRTTWLLSMKMAEEKYVMKKATNRRKEIDTYRDNLIQDIDEFQKKINDRIQRVRNEIQAEIDKKVSLNKQTVQGVLDSCKTTSSDINKLQTKLQASKTAKQNGQLYIAIKQAMSKLKADETKKSEEEMDKTNLQYKFEANQDLQALLFKQEGFGKLSLSTTLVSPWKKQVNLTKKQDINIRTESDKILCSIYGCAVLSSNKLVLADCANMKLKVLDTKCNLVVAEKKLDSYPFDVTVLQQDQIAVTLPSKREILIMTTDSNLSTVHTIPVKGECTGISYHQDFLYTVCRDPNTVVILDTKGNIYNSISLDPEQLKDPYCTVVSESSRLMYISNPQSKSIVSITIQGEILAVYQNIPRPTGMAVLDDGSLLVCSGRGTIHHISADLNQGQAIIHGLQYPWSICYNHQQHEVYIGGDGYNRLKVFSLQFV